MWCSLSVRRGRSVRKIHRFVFLVLLCSVTAGLWTFSQVRANDVLQSGTSGTCTWTYALVDNVKTLTIKPTSGAKGTLVGHDWNDATHKTDTKRVVVEGTVKVGSSAKEMFKGFSQATDMDLRGLDLSEVTDAESMFQGCSALTTLTGSANWDLGNVKKMRHMFHDCKALTEVDVRDWNVGNVENMHDMFAGCEALAKLDVSKWNVSNVTNMVGVFLDCKALTSLAVKNWDVSNVTSMYGLFHGCSSLTTLDVSAWKTGKVINMNNMFHGCSALTTLDVSNWDMSKVTVTWAMFEGCSSLTALDVSKWNTSSLKDLRYMFKDCSALTSLDLSGWVFPSLLGAYGPAFSVFSGANSLATIYLGTGVTGEGKSGLPYGGSLLDQLMHYTGASVGMAWQQINLGEGGTEESPKGKVFPNDYHLAAFHENRTARKTDREGYVRVARSGLKINFHKGNPAAQGSMSSQEYGPGEKTPLSLNDFTLKGNRFTGWKGSDNKEYADGALYTHPADHYKRVTQPGEVPPLETLDLTAQWEEVAVLTFEAEPYPSLELKLSQPVQEIVPTQRPDGCQLTVEGGSLEGKEVQWTVKSGGGDPTWLRKGDRITREDIEAAAKKDGKLIDTTFLIKVVDLCKITLDANLPSGVRALTKPSTLTPIMVEKGKEAMLPTDLECGPSYRFIGWDAKENGTFVRYNTGKITPTADITLYAQWKKVAHIACVKKESSNLQFEKEGYTVDEDTKDPLAFKVTSGVNPGQEAKWTVKDGGNKQNPDWFYLGSELTDATVREVAVKDGKLTDTTFLAEPVDVSKITLDVNLPSGVILTKPSTLNPITAEKGKEAILPTDLECGSNYKFTEWNTKEDGTGTSYNEGKITPTADITLYAQWKPVVVLTFQEKPGGNLNFAEEKVMIRIQGENPSDFLLPSDVTQNLGVGQNVKWTAIQDSNNTSWSYLATGSEKGKLPKEEIEKAAKRGDAFVATTFLAELVDDSKGKGGPDGKGTTDDKDKTGGKGTPDGKGGPDGKGTPDGKGNGGSGDNASNKLGGGSDKGTGEGGLIGMGTQSQNGAQKGAKLGGRRLPGTGDNTPSVPFGLVWLGFIVSAMGIMFRRAQEEGRAKK